jgi:hypothetical protein
MLPNLWVTVETFIQRTVWLLLFLIFARILGHGLVGNLLL